MDNMRSQWEVNRRVLEEANQQLAEGEDAQQEEARERIHYRNANEKLVTQLDNFKSMLSTLQEQDELTENPNTRIAEDPRAQEVVVEEEEEIEVEDPLVLGCSTVYYSTQGMQEFQQEWQ